MLSTKKILYKILDRPYTKSFSTGSMSASTYYTTKAVNVAVSGRKPIGIIGYNLNQAAAHIYRLDLSDDTVTVGVAIQSGNISGANVTFTVLYI